MVIIRVKLNVDIGIKLKSIFYQLVLTCYKLINSCVLMRYFNKRINANF